MIFLHRVRDILLTISTECPTINKNHYCLYSTRFPTPFSFTGPAATSFLDANSTTSCSAAGLSSTLGCGPVGAARPRGRAKSARIKERVEREARCIFDLGVGKFGDWMNEGDGEEWLRAFAVGLMVKKGVDVQVLMLLLAQHSIL